MAALLIQNEDQLKKAEDLIKTTEIDLRDPLLEEVDKVKLQAKVDRLKALIEEYRDTQQKPEPTPSKPIVLQEAAPIEQDPRPDLQEDAHLWKDLLILAHKLDQEAGRVNGEVDTLCGVLNGFRCGETRLKPGKVAGAGMWILKPDISPDKLGAWESQAEYDDYKARYLQSWGGVIPSLLKELTTRHPIPSQNGE